MRDPNKILAIYRPTCDRVAGSPLVTERAVELGLVRFERTPTGRSLTTPADFARLVEYADKLVAQHERA